MTYDRSRDERPVQPDDVVDPVVQARAELWRAVRDLGWTAEKLAVRFAEDHDGHVISDATVAQLRAFQVALVKEAESQDADAKRLVQDALGGKEVEG